MCIGIHLHVYHLQDAIPATQTFNMLLYIGCSHMITHVGGSIGQCNKNETTGMRTGVHKTSDVTWTETLEGSDEALAAESAMASETCGLISPSMLCHGPVLHMLN